MRRAIQNLLRHQQARDWPMHEPVTTESRHEHKAPGNRWHRIDDRMGVRRHLIQARPLALLARLP